MSLLARRLHSFNFIRSYSQVVNVFGRRNVDTERETQDRTSVATIPETAESVVELSGHPEEHTKERTVKIFIPAKNSMQSGTFQVKKWKLEFDNRERWENPLMGWGSTGDALSNFTNLQLSFNSKEDAIVYCQRMGYKYEVQEPNLINKRIKSYGANFSWDKKTRRTAK